MPFNPFTKPRNAILEALESEEKLSWSELGTRSGLGKASLSKYVRILLKEKRILALIDFTRKRRTTVYTINDLGMWEYQRNSVVGFLSAFKTPIVGNTTLHDGKAHISYIMDMSKTLSNGEKLNFEKTANSIIQGKGMTWLLEKVLVNVLGKKNKATITISYDPNGGFKKN